MYPQNITIFVPMNIKATGTWIVCKDEREKAMPESDILLLDSTVKQIKHDTARINTNILEVLSVGPLVQDPNIRELKEGALISVDFRILPGIVPLDREESEMGIVLQENQVMFIVHEGDGDHISG